MATLKRDTTNGQFIAVWRNSNGERVSVSTGETLHERAWRKAAVLEAEARFWEDHADGVWQKLAECPFSPRYLHAVFVGRAHIPFPQFRRLLIDAEVKFRPAATWRDRTRPPGKTSDRKWVWKGRKKSLEDLLTHAADGVTKAALRFRLDSGWPVEKALFQPLMSRSESGALGASISNNPNRRRIP